MSSSKKTSNILEKETIDLVKQFYDQDIDHKALEKAITARRNKIKKSSTLSLQPYTGPFGKSQKRHLLNRTMVGNCKRHMDDLEELSLSQAIELIFTVESLSEPTNIYYWEKNAQQYQERYISEDVGPNEPFIDRAYTDDLPPGSQEQFGHERRMAIWSIVYDGMYHQNTSIHWKLFKFLHNLVPTKAFNTIGHKGGYNYIKLVFESCFSSYKQFIYNVTIDGSMLFFLNLQLSQKETPDENYAREVQELFSVGKRPFAQFSEQDVREIARALVGWNFDYDAVVYEEGHENSSSFDPDNHDTGDKVFSSFYNNKIIQGREGPEGAEELQEVIDMLFDTEENSIYIARRLYQFFVYPALTDEIEEQIIKPLAKIYRDNNYSLIAPLKVLLQSQHFFQSDIENAMIKSPIDFNMSILKEVNLMEGILHLWNGEREFFSLFDNDLFGDKEKDLSYRKYRLTEHLNWYAGKDIGMNLLDPPSVSGWPAYYQEPVYDLFWMNSSTIARRGKLAEQYLRWGYWLDVFIDGNGVTLRSNLINYLNTFEDPLDFNIFFEELCDRFTGGLITVQAKSRIRNILLQEINVHHWSEEVGIVLSNNLDQGTYASIQWRLGHALKSLATLGEFNLH